MRAHSANPSLFKRLSTEIHNQHDNRYTLNHKRTWRDLIKKGHWPCDPKVINKKLQVLTACDQYQPRGDRLLYLCSRHKFTLLQSGKPKSAEEALERLIVQANPNNMYGQMPIRGEGRETVDVVKLENQTGTFIELKPWRTQNSPLYALLESLKNLYLFRILKANNHHGATAFENVKIAILAPFSYYQDYHFLSRDLEIHNRKNVQEYFDAIAKEFKTEIEILALNWKEEALWYVCSAISPKNTNKKTTVSVVDYSVIEPLKEKNWIELIAAGREE